MKIHVLRLSPGEDLKLSLEKGLFERQVKAGVLLSCVGSLSKVCLRFAGESDLAQLVGKFEIVSMEATVSIYGCHMHMSVADSAGAVVGGHVKEGNIINTTAELVVGEIEGMVFRRKLDERTGYPELDPTSGHQ